MNPTEVLVNLVFKKDSFETQAQMMDFLFYLVCFNTRRTLFFITILTLET